MENFKSNIKSLATTIKTRRSSITSEEATKTALIMPFFQMLGYNVFDPDEFSPEFTADLGIKKGEKVDYAIMQGSEPLILIEAKPVYSSLPKHENQLARYFTSTAAKFAILTNGDEYRFYTDIEKPNLMDQEPFFVVSLSSLKDSQLKELAKFRKESFNASLLLDTASEMKVINAIKSYLNRQFVEPDDDFLKHLLGVVYEGHKKQSVIDRHSPLIKRALKEFITETVNEVFQATLDNDTLQTVLAQPLTVDGSESGFQRAGSGLQGVTGLQRLTGLQSVESGLPRVKNASTTPSDTPDAVSRTSEVVTTPEELEAFTLVQKLLHGVVAPERLSYKDNPEYFAIRLDNNRNKWICNLHFNRAKLAVVFRGSTYKDRVIIESVQGLSQHKERLQEIARELL